MNTIVVIGAGQLGSRHLQGLALLSYELKIQVVDVSEESLQVAKNRFLEVAKDKKNFQIEFLTEINKIDKDVHTAIVATNSIIRRKVLEELLVGRRIKFLVLEKFLFPDVRDYDVVRKLLDKNGISTFVNCPRRIYPDYVEIKKMLAGQKGIMFNAVGSQWGLGCNGIHMLDLFYYLTGEGDVKLDNELIDKEIIPSKRANYIEFSGTIRGNNNEHKFSITSFAQGNSPLIITIHNDNFKLIIEESAGKVLAAFSEDSWKWETRKFEIKYQSQLTNLVIQDLIQNGTCGLPTYTESSYLHLQFLKNLISFVERTQNIRTTACLIT